jgi:cold shock CspA family protein
MRYQGRITTWKDDKGFGFITPNGGGEQVFIHISSFSNRQRRPQGNELVTYELSVDGKGRAQADTVAFVGEKPTQPFAPGHSNIPPIFAVCFLVICSFVAALGWPPTRRSSRALPHGASLVAFCAYAFDKSAAQGNEWRTQEKHAASVRPSRRLARCLGCTAPASAQVGEGFLSEPHSGSPSCTQLRSTRLVIFALRHKNAKVCTWWGSRES